MFAPNIGIDITSFWFEAGQKLVRSDRTTLVRSRSNYFYSTDNANCADFLIRSRYFAYDGQRALSLYNKLKDTDDMMGIANTFCKYIRFWLFSHPNMTIFHTFLMACT